MDKTYVLCTSTVRKAALQLFSMGRNFQQLMGIQVPSAGTEEFFFLCETSWFILELNPSPKQMYTPCSEQLSRHLRGDSVSAQSSNLIVNDQSAPQSDNKESSWLAIKRPDF